MLPKLDFFVNSVVRLCGVLLAQVHQGVVCRQQAVRVTDVISAEIARAKIGTTRLALEAEFVFIGRYGVGGGSAG